MNKLRHLPNAITITRLILVLPIAFLIVEETYVLALVLFAVSGISDGLDGFLAIVLGSLDHFPIMLVILIVAKDLAILGGVFSYTSLAGLPKIQPNLLGKLTTAAQIVLIILVLLNLSTHGSLSEHLFDVWFWVVAVMTVFDGIFYLWLWTARLAEDPRWKETL